jgi:hypothetical protein
MDAGYWVQLAVRIGSWAPVDDLGGVAQVRRERLNFSLGGLSCAFGGLFGKRPFERACPGWHGFLCGRCRLRGSDALG